MVLLQNFFPYCIYPVQFCIPFCVGMTVLKRVWPPLPDRSTRGAEFWSRVSNHVAPTDASCKSGDGDVLLGQPHPVSHFLWDRYAWAGGALFQLWLSVALIRLGLLKGKTGWIRTVASTSGSLHAGTAGWHGKVASTWNEEPLKLEAFAWKLGSFAKACWYS